MKHYFLFGQNISKKYHEEDFSEVIKSIKKGTEYQLYYFDDGENGLEDLLLAYTGWGGFATITEEEYDAIKAINI